MKTKGIMHIFTRTPLHVGAGNSVGVVDSPIQRERHTRFPVIPGSSLKGVLRDLFTEDNSVDQIFGSSQDEKNEGKISAGNLLIGEAKLLAFPVRSAKGAFAWITCPLALARYIRDAELKLDIEHFDGLEDSQCFGSEDVLLNGNVILEEYNFKSVGLCEDAALKMSKIFDDKVWATAATRLVIVNDEIFSYFVEHACEVVTRICIDDETGVVKRGALFNQEQVPSEAMFYCPVGEQKEKNSYAQLKQKISDNGNVIQIGGDSTIGLGYCSINFSDK